MDQIWSQVRSLAKRVNRSPKIQQFFVFHSLEKNAKIFAFFAKFCFILLRKKRNANFCGIFLSKSIFAKFCIVLAFFLLNSCSCSLEIRSKVFAVFLQKFSFAGKLSRKSVVSSKLSQAEKL